MKKAALATIIILLLLLCHILYSTLYNWTKITLKCYNVSGLAGDKWLTSIDQKKVEYIGMEIF